MRVAPSDAAESFFSVSAQVVPVILLALVIEVRAVGTGIMRASPELTGPRLIERARRVLEGMLIAALLLAEGHALDVVGENPAGQGDPRLVWPGLVWGFTTVAVLAVFGTRRARPELQIESELRDTAVKVTITAGNRYGDKDVNALLNVYVEPGHGDIQKCRADGSNAVDVRTSKSTEPGEVKDWTVLDERLPLTAGDWGYLYYLIEPGEHRGDFGVVAHLDHPELRGGRFKESARVEC